MTYEESAVGQTIGRLLTEHPGVDPSADGALATSTSSTSAARARRTCSSRALRSPRATGCWILAPDSADGPPAGPALPMLLDDGYTRVIYAAALADSSLEIWRGTFTRNPG
jgi:hypothetical protein